MRSYASVTFSYSAHAWVSSNTCNAVMLPETPVDTSSHWADCKIAHAPLLLLIQSSPNRQIGRSEPSSAGVVRHQSWKKRWKVCSCTGESNSLDCVWKLLFLWFLGHSFWDNNIGGVCSLFIRGNCKMKVENFCKRDADQSFRWDSSAKDTSLRGRADEQQKKWEQG